MKSLEMQVSPQRLTHWGLLLVLLVLAITSCSTAPTEPEENPSTATPVLEAPGTPGTQAYAYDKAPVQTVQVQRDTLSGAEIVVTGELSDGCTEIHEANVERQGSTFQVELTTRRPVGQACTEVLVPYAETIPLDDQNLAPGEYTVIVNDVNESFNVDENEVTPEASSPTATTPEMVEAYVATAKGHLAERLNVAASEIEEEGTESSASDPEVYFITLRVGEELYEYRAEGRTVALVSDPLPPAVTPSPGTVLDDYPLVVDALREAGLEVQFRGAVQQPFFSPPGQTFSVAGYEVMVFEYPDEASAAAEAAQISSDGYEIDDTMVEWTDTPHFYQMDNVLALYVGDDERVQEVMETIFGTQFAGG